MSPVADPSWPVPLVGVAAGGLILGAMLLLSMFARIGRRLRDKQQPPVGIFRSLFNLAITAVLLGAGLGAAGLLFALRGYQTFTQKTHVAEVQCIELGPGKLRLYFTAVGEGGKKGETRTYDLDGDQWTVSGDVLRFQPYLTVLGLETVH